MDTQICPQCNQIGAILAKNKPEKELKYDNKKKVWKEIKNKQYKFYCSYCDYKFKGKEEVKANGNRK